MGHILFINVLNSIIHYFANFFKCYRMFKCLHITDTAITAALTIFKSLRLLQFLNLLLELNRCII